MHYHFGSKQGLIKRHELGSARGMPELPPEGQRSSDELRRDLGALLTAIPEPARQMRIAQAQSLCIHAAADRERAVTSGQTSVPFDRFANSLLDGITGFLAAPESAATRQRRGRAGDPGHDVYQLL